MATNKEARNPRKKKNKNESLQTKDQIIAQYLKKQLVDKTIVTPEYVEEYAEIQGKVIRETNVSEMRLISCRGFNQFCISLI